MNKVAIVTGGSGGIGRCTAAALKAAGCIVYEISRTDKPAPGITHLCGDITSDEQVRSAIGAVLGKEGRIDILVNNAGFGISGAAEFTASSDSHRQLELNLFGMDNVTRAVLPAMREQRCGRIICVSSIAGVLPLPFQLWYSVSKAAINAYVLALQNEVRPFGITVCAVMPGDIATGFTASREKTDAGNDVYSGRIERSVSSMERDEREGMGAETAGKYIANTALKKSSRPLMAIGLSYKAAAIAAKLLPRALSNRIMGRLYAK